MCSTRNVELVRSIGADRVIDYSREDFTQSGPYDAILDCIGDRPLSACRLALTKKGIYVVIGAPDGRWIGGLSRFLAVVVMSPFVSQTLTGFLAIGNNDDLTAIRDLIAAGRVTPVIDRTYPLGEAADACAYLEEGHVRGKVVVTMNDER